MFRKSGKKGSKIIQNAEEFEESVNLVKVDLPKKRGISASLLMRMQLDYNMQLAESDQTLMERLKQVRKYAALL